MLDEMRENNLAKTMDKSLGLNRTATKNDRLS